MSKSQPIPFHLILASGSPRRKGLLTEGGYSFTVSPPKDVEEESPRYSSDPAALVIRNAQKKAEAIARQIAPQLALFLESSPLTPASSEQISAEGTLREAKTKTVILACDTVAYIAVPNVASLPISDKSSFLHHSSLMEILGKPADREDARRMLRLLSGSDHAVVSGLALISLETGVIWTASETTTLYMTPLSDQTIEDYLDSGAWEGKAGAFGYQDGNDWLRCKSGSESNIVGLPMELLRRLLESIR